MEPSVAGALQAGIPVELLPAAEALTRIGRPAAQVAWETLALIDDSPDRATPVRALKARAGIGGDLLERLLIWQAAQSALPRVDSLPLDASTRLRLAEQLSHYHEARGSLEVGGYSFVRAAKMATFRLFPAGPLDWVVSGIRRAWIFEAFRSGGLTEGGRLLRFIVTRMGRRSPCFFLHVAPAPRNRALALEKEALKAYHRVARCLESQPEARGIIGHAWFFDPVACRDQPHLAALSRPFLMEGGLIVTLGPAAPDSGVLEGNAARRKAYLDGRIRYRYGLAVWPREAVLRWAKAHPELLG